MQGIKLMAYEMPDKHPTPELNSQYLSFMRNTEPRLVLNLLWRQNGFETPDCPAFISQELEM